MSLACSRMWLAISVSRRRGGQHSLTLTCIHLGYKSESGRTERIGSARGNGEVAFGARHLDFVDDGHRQIFDADS